MNVYEMYEKADLSMCTVYKITLLGKVRMVLCEASIPTFI